MGFYFEKIWTKNSMTFFCFKKKRHVENSFGGEKLFWKQKIFKREKAHGFYFQE